ncbi:MAG TPA: hybrid sensor histidine kinase/response regulator [Bacteroidales bacterium]|nr:hybrid sensor histidine kinase/response regulator [Bacteroidales bacterium]
MEKNNKLFRVLVVDDNPRNIQVIGSILKDSGYDVGFALNGSEALDMLSDSLDFDLVLLDIKMPGMDGFEVCSFMQQDERLKEIPVIFLSASHDIEIIIAALNAGGVDYVSKPFNSQELISRVNTHIQLRFKSQELKQNAIELEKLNNTKDKFFSIIAHDLRNPFGGILLIAKTLRESLPTCSPEEIDRQIGLIISATEGGFKLLENLLVWSRSQTGAIKFEPAEFSLEKMIKKVIELILPQATAKNIGIEFQSKPARIRIRTDEAMFCHVLRNLLSNSIKFTKGGGTVKVEANMVGTSVEISVADDGIGISASDQARLFRIDGQISSRPGTLEEAGSGLGLILCKEFMDKMGGTIQVESELGNGSRFTFTLPCMA